MAGLHGCGKEAERNSLRCLQSASEAGQRCASVRCVTSEVCSPLTLSASAQALTRMLPLAEVFGPWELLDALKRDNQELGLIIDLTFTTRYYTLQVNTHTHIIGAFPLRELHDNLTRMSWYLCVSTSSYHFRDTGSSWMGICTGKWPDGVRSNRNEATGSVLPDNSVVILLLWAPLTPISDSISGVVCGCL